MRWQNTEIMPTILNNKVTVLSNHLPNCPNRTVKYVVFFVEEKISPLRQRNMRESHLQPDSQCDRAVRENNYFSDVTPEF